PRDWRVPDHARVNTPARLAGQLRPLAERGALPLFPLGSDFDETEQRIVPALMWLKASSAGGWAAKLRLAREAVAASASAADMAIYERLGLAAPRGLEERALRRIVAAALARTSANAQPG